MTLVSFRIDDGVAVVTIDNPPVSTGNVALRRDLLDVFTRLRSESGLRAVVLHSAQAHFYSGSDISEFDGPILLPLLPEILNLIEGLDAPVVAALNGLTLGGGLEVALACDARIAERGAKLGLPEVTLGMLPGAGGTVRLPRLIGAAAAIEMIASGRPVSADVALASGLVDQVVDKASLMDAALAFANTAKKRRVRLLEAPASDPVALAAAIEAGTRGGRARPNIIEAIELVQTGLATDGDTALVAERAAFDRLRVGAEAANLRYLFFAKRAAAKGLSVDAPPADVSSVGIAGAGTMGSAIAAVCLKAGLSVVLVDTNPDVLDRALASLAEKRANAPRWGELRSATDLAQLADADLVIDAVFEDMEVKIDLLTRLESVVRPDIVLASNTSYLDLNAIGARLSNPERFVGLHFFNPADRNALVEVVRTAATDDRTLATTASLVKRFGKTGIPATVGEGFVANRVYADYRGQAEMLVEDGATPSEVDDAMRALGLPIGPFAVGDMSGLDIAWARRKRLAVTRDPRQRYVAIPDLLCESGRLGRKSNAGWYDYPEGESRGVPSPVVGDLIVEARAQKGIVARSIPTEEIQRRIVCAMLVAAAEVVASGVAQRATDIDVAFTEGFAFPVWLGGPLRYAASQDPAWLAEGLSAVHDSDPIGFAAAELRDGTVNPAITAVLDSVSPR